MSNYNYSDLLNKYLQDNISREELHALEKRALDDPFLMDAMEGFAYSNLKKSSANIDQIKINIKSKDNSPKSSFRNIIGIAAGIAILISAFFVFKNYNSPKTVLSDQMETTIKQIPQKDHTAASNSSLESVENSDESGASDLQSNHKISPSSKSHKKQNSSTKIQQKEKLVKLDNEIQDELINEEEMVFADIEEDQINIESKITDEKVRKKKSRTTTKPIQSRGRIMINRIEPPREAFNKFDLPTEDVEVKPLLGLVAFGNYIRKNKKSFNVNGKVVIDFTIRPDGQAINFRVFESLCRACDEDAIRLIREGGSWLVNPPDEEVDVRYEIEY